MLILRADNGSLPMVVYRMPPTLLVRVHSKSSCTAAGVASLAASEGAGNCGPGSSPKSPGPVAFG